MRTFLAATSLAILTACGGGSSGDTGPKPLDRKAIAPSQAGDAYYVAAHDAVAARVADREIRQAKNIILFIGDGMGVSTVTAARIYAGQQANADGESHRLTMETLPQAAFSKTYSHDFQVSDSASTATAMVTGIKSRSRTLGVTSDAVMGDCETSIGKGTDTLFEIAERAGLATGIISTARITHATPASTYAETPMRDWEDDTETPESAEACADIAEQLIDWPEGDGFEVVLGGGRRHFLPADVSDPEEPDRAGRRTDERNLIEEWEEKSDAHGFIWNLAQFREVDFATEARILGLFEQSHLEFELDRPQDTSLEPSISDMTEAAITRLSQDTDGYVLMIEGGRIDHAHHGTNAARALADTVAFDAAVAKAIEMTDPADTLIIVTADHSHTLTISGYPHRGNPILGKVAYGSGVTATAEDGKPYTTLGYANGPVACQTLDDGELDCARPDVSEIPTDGPDYRQQALVYLGSETHAGEDVPVYSRGPGSELLNGVIEQNEIFHVMGKASGLVE